MLSEIEHALDTIAVHDDVRLIVFSGTGKHFCAGGDIKDMAKARMTKSTGQDPIMVLNRRFGTLITKVQTFFKPIVMSVRGAAMGGGLWIGMCGRYCDR